MKILSFGIAREIVSGPIEMSLDGDVSVAMLQTKLSELYPGLRQLSSFVIAVNGEYGQPERIVRNGDEIAIIPPVSGG